MFSCSDSEVNPLASILAADSQRAKVIGCQSWFPGAKSPDTFLSMKKRAGRYLMFISVFSALLLLEVARKTQAGM
jgi:hypothetical protein